MDKKIFSDEEVFEQIKQPYSARFVKELARSRKLKSAGHYFCVVEFYSARRCDQRTEALNSNSDMASLNSTVLCVHRFGGGSRDVCNGWPGACACA